MLPYRVIEQIMSDGSFNCLGPERLTDRLLVEVRAIKKKMVFLPTARESEALPEIALLRDFSRLLLDDQSKEIRKEWQVNEKLEQLFMEELFEPVCADIIKARIYTNKEIVKTADSLFTNLIAFATHQLARQKFYYNSIINTIIDKSADYYKTNGKEHSITNYPFGELHEPDENHKKWIDGLEKGALVDCLKSYAGKKNWSRAYIESRDHGLLKVRFVNDIQDTFIQNKYFEIAPLGSRESDYNWRENLKVGDLVDHYSFRSDWGLYKIISINEEESIYKETIKTLEIQKENKVATPERAQEQTNQGQNASSSTNPVYGSQHISSLNYLNDSIYNNRYNTSSSANNYSFEKNQSSPLWAGNNDQYSSQTMTVKAHSPVLATPGKYSSKAGCQIDDAEDSLYLSGEKKKRFAILRPNTLSGACSIYLVKYINTFGENGGFDYIMNVLEDKIKVHQEIIGQLVRMVQNASENLIEPFIKLHGEKILKSISTYIIDAAEKNLRNLTQQNLFHVIESISSLAQRVYTSKKAKTSSQLLTVQLAILCLKSDILEKQFFGAKQLLSIEAKSREYDTDISRAFLAESLERENIYEKIVKGHPGLIVKGSGILKLLLSENKISDQQLSIIWEQICKTDSDTRSALLTMIKEIQWDFSKEQIQFFVRKMLENADEITSETFDLLCTFKKIGWNKYNDLEVLNLVNDVFWEILQSDKDLKKEMSKEVMVNFVKSLDSESANPFVIKIIANYLENKNKLRNLKLLKYMLKHSETLSLIVLEVMQEKKVIDYCTREIVAIIQSKIRSDAQNSQSIRRNNYTEENSVGQADSQQPISDVFTNEEKFNIELRLKLFGAIIRYEGFDKMLFSFSHFEQIWDAVFFTARTEDFIHNWIREYLISSKITLFIPQLKTFFNANFRKLLTPSKYEFYKFFMLIFRQVNISEGGFLLKRIKFETMGFIQMKSDYKSIVTLNKPVEELFGIDAFWELFNESTTYNLFSQLANYLTKVYLPPEFFESENIELYDNEKRKLIDKALELFFENDNLKAVKASLLLMRIIKAEERRGKGFLISLASLKEGEKLIINVEKDTKYLKERTKLEVFENQTVMDLKELISKEYRIDSESILLVRENDEVIPINDNSLTLENAHIRMRDLLVVREAELPEVVEANVLDDTGTKFSDQAYLVFQEIFSDYSSDGKMSKENLAKFTSNATDGTPCNVTDDRITTVFEKYDREKRGYIFEKDFIDFYLSAASAGEHRLRTVKQNLQSLRYGKDLKLKRTSGKFCNHFKNQLRNELCNKDSFGIQLWKYIEENEKNSASNANENITEANMKSPQLLEILFRMIEFLSPSTYKIKELINDPVKVLTNEQNPNLWRYCQILLHALIFKRLEMQRFLNACGIEYDEIQYQALLSKVTDFGFYESQFNSLSAIFRQISFTPSNYDSILSGFRIIEKFFKVFVSINDPDMVTDLKGFLNYFTKQKKKVTEKTQTDSPAKKEKEDDLDKIGKIFPDKDKDKEKDKENEQSIEEEQIKMVRLSLGDAALMNTVTQKLNFKKINGLLLDVLKNLNDFKVELSKFQKGVLKSAMIIFICSLKLNDHELPALLKLEQFQKIMLLGLSHEKILVRLYYKNFYAFLTSSSTDIKIKIDFLKILINSITNNNNEDFHSIIELACNILGEIGEMKTQNQAQLANLHNEVNFSELFQNFSSKLISHASSEVTFDEKEDSLLIGYMAFMEKILKADEIVLKQLDQNQKKTLIMFLFKDCLFEITSSGFVFNNIKCKSKKSRAAAINLLVQLAKGDYRNTINLIVSGLYPLSKNLPDLVPQTYSLMLDSDRKNQLGFLGLKNLGCVCYMIAMLQQFYCTPAFRHGILMASDKKLPNVTEVKGIKIDDNLFHQLQKMFSYLDFSERRDYNPLEFCLSYKDYSGQPVNVMVQQDADEFLKVIFDKLEDALKSGPYIGVLNSVFSGKLCNVIVCKGCGFEKVNEEAFTNLSLEVKNLSNLNESFEKFIQEDIISDFMCDKCKNKCDISKKALLKSLPNVLIVYLKKMVFDLDLLMNIKIHSKYEFPTVINLKKYMHFAKEEEALNLPEDQIDVENLTNEISEEPAQTKKTDKEALNANEDENTEDYEYKLVGVVIHKGNAEYGHYTSLINVNRNDPRREHISKDFWLEFDDSRVSKFDMAHFQEECFGSNEDKEFPANLMSIENHISKSAYILIYDKIKKSPITFPFTEETISEREKIISCLRDPAAVEIGPDFLRTNFYNLKQTLPESFSQEIQKDNSALVLEQQLLSSSFTNSLADIFGNIDLSISVDPNNPNDDSIALKKTFAETVLQTLPSYLFKIYCVSNDNYRIGKIVRTIENALGFLTFAKYIGNNKQVIYSIEQRIYQFYVDNVYNNIKSIFNAFINSSDQFIKNALSDFVINVFGSVIKNFHIQKFEVDHNIEIEPSTPLKVVAQVHLLKTVVILCSFIQGPEVNIMQFRKLSQIFGVLQKIAEQNMAVRDYMLRTNILTTIYDLYLSIDGSKLSQIEKTLSPVLSIIHALIMQLKTAMLMKEDNFVQLENYYKYFVRIDFFAKILKEDYTFNNFEAVKALIVTIAYENHQISDQLCYICLKGISSTSESDSIGYLEALRALLNIKDSLVAHRVKSIFGVPRLNEQAVTIESQQKSFLYGLCKESSLKKAVYGYTTPFGMEAGILEILFKSKDISENSALLMIYYVLELAEIYPQVLAYIAHIQPPNYLTATYYDWFKSYIDHHLKYLSTAYSSYRSDVSLLYFNSLPEKLDNFEKKLRAYIESQNITLTSSDLLFSMSTVQTSSYPSVSQDKISEATEEVQLFSFKKNYVIGKTNKVELLSVTKLDEDEFGLLKMKFHLNNVALMESRPTGSTNLSIPQTCLNYDNYINKSSITDPDLVRFFGGKDEILYDNREDPESSNLNPIFQDEEAYKGVSTDFKSQSKKIKEKLPLIEDCELFVNRNYIFRISISNKTNENYYVRVKIYGEGSVNFNQQLFVVPLRSRRSNLAVQNVTLNNIDGTFAGLKVAVSMKKLDSLNMKHYSEEDFTEFIDVFEFPNK